jgi:rhodanese-related sulfurtransferase
MLKKRQPTLIVWFILAGLALLLAACGASGAPSAAGEGAAQGTRKMSAPGGGSYTDVNAAGLAAMLENKDFPLINVHIPYEGELEDTDLFIPYDEIEQHLDQLPADKNARIVLYCRSGRMSTEAAQVLAGLGYTDVWNLDGGMVEWQQAGYPLLDKPQ